LKENQNVDLRSFLFDLRKYFEISFYPVLRVIGLKNHFLTLKIDVSTPYKHKIEGKPKCSFTNVLT
jgi:hypothetical protein